MNNEIRQAHALDTALEDKLFNLQDEAIEFFDSNQVEQALKKITEAWELLPEPKFNTSCSYLILCDFIEILNAAGKHHEAKEILDGWILDLKTSGYKIYETKPFILLGETFLCLKEIDAAKEAFYEAVSYGAGKRDFSDKPGFYYDIATKKITSADEIQKLFDDALVQGDVSQPAKTLDPLSDEISDRIELLSEEGNVYIEAEEYEKAIAVWKKALALIPNPQNTYAESLWLESSIGEAFFLQENYDAARLHFLNAMSNIEENPNENPFILLRTGQLYFEAGEWHQAKAFLLKAYMLEGEEIFEESDEKYFHFLQQNVKL